MQNKIPNNSEILNKKLSTWKISVEVLTINRKPHTILPANNFKTQS